MVSLTLSLYSSCGNTDSNKWLSITCSSVISSYTLADRELTDSSSSVNVLAKNWGRREGGEGGEGGGERVGYIRVH